MKYIENKRGKRGQSIRFAEKGYTEGNDVYVAFGQTL